MPTRDIHDVTVSPLYGDPMLEGHGIGHIDFDAHGQVTQLRCGIFAQNKPIPKQDEECVITGEYDDTKLPFKFTLKCTTPGRPQSVFTP
jgi:hypothetical protein